MEPSEFALGVILAGCPETADDTKVQGILNRGRIFDGVVGELRTAGFSPLEILSLVKFIYDLIAEYGPMIAEIVAKIRERFGK